jgi:2-keto-4-pentenoate hydratase/2-oxohepta-3-ene-1,7-dioic acid hydratase in catechol pathway
MRFATFTRRGGQLCGVVTDDGIHAFEAGTVLLDVLTAASDLAELLAIGAELVKNRPAFDPAEATLRPPLQPPTVRDFMTFERHVEGVAARYGDTVPQEWYDEPVFYFSNPYSMIGARDDVAIPPGCTLFDYELEVAAVVGRPGANLTPEQARDHIAGYTLFNDWSARDLQGREMKAHLGPSKGKDSAATLGPYLVTADEFENRRTADGLLDLALTVHVNGVEYGRDTLAHMAWSFEELAAHASRGTVVRAGDVLASGTCADGCLAEAWGRRARLDPPPLKPGDTVTVTAECIGTISNTVVPGPQLAPVRPARRRSEKLPMEGGLA